MYFLRVAKRYNSRDQYGSLSTSEECSVLNINSRLQLVLHHSKMFVAWLEYTRVNEVLKLFVHDLKGEMTI